MKIKIFCDVYNISNRLKYIDKDYFVVYDTSKNKFEIHNKNQVGSSYCLTLPYSCLDERTIDYVLQTKSENIERILQTIDNENKIKESAEKSSALSNAYELISEEIK